LPSDQAPAPGAPDGTQAAPGFGTGSDSAVPEPGAAATTGRETAHPRDDAYHALIDRQIRLVAELRLLDPDSPAFDRQAAAGHSLLPPDADPGQTAWRNAVDSVRDQLRLAATPLERRWAGLPADHPLAVALNGLREAHRRRASLRRAAIDAARAADLSGGPAQADARASQATADQDYTNALRAVILAEISVLDHDQDHAPETADHDDVRELHRLTIRLAAQAEASEARRNADSWTRPDQQTTFHGPAGPISLEAHQAMVADYRAAVAGLDEADSPAARTAARGRLEQVELSARRRLGGDENTPQARRWADARAAIDTAARLAAFERIDAALPAPPGAAAASTWPTLSAAPSGEQTALDAPAPPKGDGPPDRSRDRIPRRRRSRDRILPYADADRVGHYYVLREDENPAEVAARVRAEGALAVGDVVSTHKAAGSWYLSWEAADRARREALAAAPPAAQPADEPAPPSPGDADAPADAPSPDDEATAPAPPRFRPRGQEDLAPPGEMAKARANLRALEVLALLREAGRPASPEEQAELARWSAWGALPGVFDDAVERLAAERERLREALSDAEWRAARGTTPNAHYTDAALVTAGWKLLADLGFTGGRVLEAGCGSGNWIGLAPDGVNMVGVELDPTTAAIASLLYPDAEIHSAGFETTRFPAGSFDAVVGNVPFGNYPVIDPVYNPAGKLAIHNAFIAKSLGLVKPGGIVAVITSTYTMDARDPAARQAFHAAGGELLGAIRLPRGAHQAAAGTSVATDLVVFRRRREGEEPAPFDWELAVPVELPAASRDDVPDDVERSDAGVPLARINQVFAERPAAMLGRLAYGGAGGRAALTVLAEFDAWPDQLTEQAGELVARAHARYGADGPVAWPGPPEPVDDAALDAAAGIAPEAGSLAIGADGELIRLRPDGTGKPVAATSVAQERELRALIELLADVRAVLAAQADADGGDEACEAARERLNLHYDAYTSAYGLLSDTTVEADGVDPDTGKPLTARVPRVPRQILTDPGWGWLAGLEIVDPTSKAVTKAAIFTERVISAGRVPTGAENAAEALAASLAVHGRVELDYIAGLLGLDAEAAFAELGERVYRDPVDGTAELAELYLSGNVKAKLADAREAADRDPVWARNVAALEAVQPEDWTPGEIHAQLGAAWIPAGVVRAFVAELLEVDRRQVQVEHSPLTATWKVKAPQNLLGSTDWGTGRLDARRLIDQALNLAETKVWDTYKDGDGRERSVVNPTETQAAQDKRQAIQERFADWLWEDASRAARLVRIYNDRFNTTVLPEFDGSHLTFPGMAATFVPHQHQRDAVWRIMTGVPGTERNTLLGHVVGAGKTATMVAAGMEMKRLGLVNKPMYVVPNHMLEQFSREFVQLYPLARVLVATKDDLAKDARQAFAARCATGNWDAVVITHASFKRLPVSPATETRFIETEMAAYEAALDAAKDSDPKSFTVKELEKRLKRFRARMEVLKGEAEGARDAGDVHFEDLGVDFIFGDEAHTWKGRTIAARTPTGIPSSVVANDMAMKLEHLRDAHGEQFVCYAAGTPIANSLAEMWVVQYNLDRRTLERAGLREFDSWAGTFTRVVTALEMRPEGGSFRMVSRIAAFMNVPELITMFRAVADIKTADDLNLPRPALEGGERETIVIPPSAELLDYIAQLGERAEKVRAKRVDPDVDNMLLISTDGRKASLDLRLVGAGQDPAAGKAERVAVEVAAEYRAHRDDRFLVDPKNPGAGYDKLPGALQLIFCDLGTPGGDKDGFVFYDELRERLVSHGVPIERIAFIHEANTDLRKAKLFARARAGEIAVLIGSTVRMGVGTNVQKRLRALHHVDIPWRPMDIEQRDGRALRQGNLNPTIRIIRYVTEGSFDAYSAQTVERKARFIGQVMAGDRTIRVIDDLGSAQALDAAQVKAIATGNPDVLRLAELDDQITRLRRQRVAHERNQLHLDGARTAARERIAVLDRRLARFEEILPRRRETQGKAFRAVVSDPTYSVREVYTERDRAGAGLLAVVRNARAERGQPKQVGELGGLAVFMSRDARRNHYLWVEGLTEKEGRNLGSDLRPAVINPVALMSGLEQQIRNLDGHRARLAGDRDQAADQVETATARLGQPWPDNAVLSRAEAERQALAARLTAIDAPAETEQTALDVPAGGSVVAADAPADLPVQSAAAAGGASAPVSGNGPTATSPAADPAGSVRAIAMRVRDVWHLRIAGQRVASARIDEPTPERAAALRDAWLAAYTGPDASWTQSPLDNSRVLTVPAGGLAAPDTVIATVSTSTARPGAAPSDTDVWTLRAVSLADSTQPARQQAIAAIRQAADGLPRSAAGDALVRCELARPDGTVLDRHYAVAVVGADHRGMLHHFPSPDDTPAAVAALAATGIPAFAARPSPAPGAAAAGPSPADNASAAGVAGQASGPELVEVRLVREGKMWRLRVAGVPVARMPVTAADALRDAWVRAYTGTGPTIPWVQAADTELAAIIPKGGRPPPDSIIVTVWESPADQERWELHATGRVPRSLLDDREAGRAEYAENALRWAARRAAARPGERLLLRANLTTLRGEPVGTGRYAILGWSDNPAEPARLWQLDGMDGHRHFAALAAAARGALPPLRPGEVGAVQARPDAVRPGDLALPDAQVLRLADQALLDPDNPAYVDRTLQGWRALDDPPAPVTAASLDSAAGLKRRLGNAASPPDRRWAALPADHPRAQAIAALRDAHTRAAVLRVALDDLADDLRSGYPTIRERAQAALAELQPEHADAVRAVWRAETAVLNAGPATANNVQELDRLTSRLGARAAARETQRRAAGWEQRTSPDIQFDGPRGPISPEDHQAMVADYQAAVDALSTAAGEQARTAARARVSEVLFAAELRVGAEAGTASVRRWTDAVVAIDISTRAAVYDRIDTAAHAAPQGRAEAVRAAFPRPVSAPTPAAGGGLEVATPAAATTPVLPAAPTPPAHR